METISYGKALILGGYLILYPKYYGVVLACSSKISCKVEVLQENSKTIYVESDKFAVNCKYKFAPLRVEGESNGFINEALEVSMYFLELFLVAAHNDLKIVISADQEFYVAGKTGLGSSAALTTVIVKALFQYYQLEIPGLANFASQIAHFRAQGKIGSGFDISACIYGSHLFRRKNSELMTSMFERLETSKNKIFEELNNWENPIHFELPESFQLVLACLENSGSNTRVLVKNLVSWMESTKSFAIFDEVQVVIDEFIKVLPDENIEKLRELSKSLKELLWQISENSKTEVLPLVIKQLLENIENSLEDVVFSSVPGAGGYDAFYFIIHKPTWEEAAFYLSSSEPNLKILNVKYLK